MAIINSLGIGKGQKSAGELTFRHVRGRTIASSRIRENKSRTVLQGEQRDKFKAGSSALSKIAFLINQAFEKSQYGSPRNNFFRINKEAVLGLDAGLETPYDVINALVGNANYMTYGAGNVLVSQQGNDIYFTAYGVSADCSVTQIWFMEDGTVEVGGAQSELSYDSSTQSVTFDTTGSSPLNGEVNAIGVIIFKTPAGIAKCPYVKEHTAA